MALLALLALSGMKVQKCQKCNAKIYVSFSQNGWDYICITDIARQKNALEPKDVVKNWMRLKNTIEYLGMWEALNNPQFKGVEFDPLLREAGSNAFTLSPSRWIELTGAAGTDSVKKR